MLLDWYNTDIVILYVYEVRRLTEIIKSYYTNIESIREIVKIFF